jgi:hypothetical protein
MENLFWILAAIALLSCLILFGIDYSNSIKDKQSKSSLITGYVVLTAALIFACWGFNAIPEVVIRGAAVIATAYFGRYFIRKIGNRKI